MGGDADAAPGSAAAAVGAHLSTDETVNQLFVLKRQQLGLRREMMEERARLAAEASRAPPARRAARPRQREFDGAWEAARIVDPSLRRGYSGVPDAALHTAMRARSNTVTVDLRAVMAMLARQQCLMAALEQPPPAEGGHSGEGGGGKGGEGAGLRGPAVQPSVADERDALRRRAAALQQQADAVDDELASKLEAAAQASAKVKQLQAHLADMQEEEAVLGGADLLKQQKRREDNVHTSLQSTLESTERLRAETASVHSAIQINHQAAASAEALIEQQRQSHNTEVCRPQRSWLSLQHSSVCVSGFPESSRRGCQGSRF